MKKLSIIILILLLLFIAIFSYFFFRLLRYASTPASHTHKETIVNIPLGQGLGVTAKMLYEAGIVKAPSEFRRLARIKAYDKKIRAGEYLLSPAMSPSEVLDIMAKGKVLLRKLTIPEGASLRQIAAIVAGTGLVRESDFLKAARNTGLLHENGIDALSPEGYLFPDTYHFSRNVTPEKIVSAMIRRFSEVFTPEWKARARDLGFSVHEVVTLASVIEKETGAAFERPMIASVFHNRLKKGMRLESDPTVIYGIKDFDGNITRKHLNTYTPYNTYRIKGLPLGPIANPGKAALEATLYPEETQFIFFVSKDGKTHQFSSNLRDHNRAVRKYQLGKN